MASLHESVCFDPHGRCISSPGCGKDHWPVVGQFCKNASSKNLITSAGFSISPPLRHSTCHADTGMIVGCNKLYVHCFLVFEYQVTKAARSGVILFVKYLPESGYLLTAARGNPVSKWKCGAVSWWRHDMVTNPYHCTFVRGIRRSLGDRLVHCILATLTSQFISHEVFFLNGIKWRRCRHTSKRGNADAGK